MLIKKIFAAISERLKSNFRYIIVGFDSNDLKVTFAHYGSRAIFTRKMCNLDHDIIAGLLPEQACLLGMLAVETETVDSIQHCKYPKKGGYDTVSLARGNTVIFRKQEMSLKQFILNRDYINRIDPMAAYNFGIAYSRSSCITPLLPRKSQLSQHQAEIISFVEKCR